MSLFGTGILKGLGYTLKHFLMTYAEDLKYLGRKSGVAGTARAVRRQNPKARGLVTIEYPKEKAPMPEHFRNIPFLVYDTEKKEDKCTSCGICAKVCPPQCIWIVRTEDPVTKRPIPAPREFFIDSTICMNCGYCAEFCPFDAIKMNLDYELGYYVEDAPDGRMVLDKAMLMKPDTYHASIHPTAWQAEVGAKTAKAAPAPAAPKPAAAPAAAAPKPAAAKPPGAAAPPGAAKPPGAAAPPGAAKPPGAAAPPGAAKPPGAAAPPGAAKPPGAAAPPGARPPPGAKPPPSA